jgi:hypothetical protein
MNVFSFFGTMQKEEKIVIKYMKNTRFNIRNVFYRNQNKNRSKYANEQMRKIRRTKTNMLQFSRTKKSMKFLLRNLFSRQMQYSRDSHLKCCVDDLRTNKKCKILSCKRSKHHVMKIMGLSQILTRSFFVTWGRMNVRIVLDDKSEVNVEEMRRHSKDEETYHVFTHAILTGSSILTGSFFVTWGRMNGRMVPDDKSKEDVELTRRHSKDEETYHVFTYAIKWRPISRLLHSYVPKRSRCWTVAVWRICGHRLERKNFKSYHLFTF